MSAAFRTAFRKQRKDKPVLAMLRDYESRNVTYIDPEGAWPIVWETAQGMHVTDINGKTYLDMTAAFGVAACGHANRAVVRAGQKQMARLLHAMGDVHPHRLKAELACKLSQLTFERWSRAKPKRVKGKTIFANSGFEAVEAALKTAALATGKSGVACFTGGYHGLGYGALNVTERQHFRGPFRSQLTEFGAFFPFPKTESDLAPLREQLTRALSKKSLGAILVEPLQARGGIHAPPRWFLTTLREFCDEHDLVLIADEIYTGFGRTGEWFAVEHEKVTPDLICLGKALTGGFPLSACVGSAELMDRSWPASTGEAIHTSTFLGHPVGCAMALANISELDRRALVKRSREVGEELMAQLRSLRSRSCVMPVRGRGLMVGLELNLPDGKPATAQCLGLIKRLLHRGFIFLPEGEHANVLAFTPPLIVTTAQLRAAVRAVQEELEATT